MSKEEWIRKLTSRKFWAAISAFATGLILYLQHPTTDAQAITALIMSLGSLIAYIIGEGLIDAVREGGDTYVVTQDDLDTHPPEE